MKSLFKRVSILVCFLFLATSVNAQSLKNYVCIVRGNISEENETFLNNIKDSLERNGYTYYAGYVNTFLKGTFGSGFIWYAPNGKPYILTNRHVVSNYESVNISFENDDGSVSEFKNMKILFIDDDVDIALVSLPDSFKKDGLVFSTKKLLDGDDVFSAGFPGLGGEPSWQLGKGIVSNSSAKIKELIDPEISTIIQHTAQIDGGNSGGPLLIRDSSVKIGYKVCGINTWRALSRQNTNFAIPSVTIESVVKSNYINKTKTSFDARTATFIKVASIKDDFSGLVTFISNSMVSQYGEKAIRDVLATASSSVRSYISDVFEINPIEGLRYALAYKVWEKLNSDERLNIGEISDETTGKNVKILSGDSSFNSFWIEDHGTWQLSEFEGIEASKKVSNKEKARNKNGSSFSIEDPYILSVSGGYLRNFTESDNGFYLDFVYRMRFFDFGLSVLRDSVTTEKEDSSKKVSENPIDIGPFAQLKLPLQFDRLLVMPFAECRFGISFASDFLDSGLNPIFVGYGFGLETAYNTEKNFSPFIGGKFLSNIYSDDNSDSISVYNLVIYAGIKFLEK